MLPELPDYLTAEELAELTRLKVQSLAAMRCKGTGPVFTKMGSKVRYPKQAVVSWLTVNTGQSTAAIEAANAERN